MSEFVTCSQCNGSGESTAKSIKGDVLVKITCPSCQGTKGHTRTPKKRRK